MVFYVVRAIFCRTMNRFWTMHSWRCRIYERIYVMLEVFHFARWLDQISFQIHRNITILWGKENNSFREKPKSFSATHFIDLISAIYFFLSTKTNNFHFICLKIKQLMFVLSVNKRSFVLFFFFFFFLLRSFVHFDLFNLKKICRK